MILPRKNIAVMAPYALANLEVQDGKNLLSLSQNESLRPPSPHVAEMVSKSLVDGMLYPDPDWTKLRHMIAEKHNIQPEQIVCGNGSLDLIGAIMRVFAGPDRAVLAPAHAYPYFRTATQIAAARFDTAEEIENTVCISTLLEAVKPDTGIVCIANPGNPTGTRVSKSDLRRLRQALREDILLIVDEAYGEFSDHLGERCFDMAEAENTIVLRTFSKAYGLAGYRVGWGLFPINIGSEIRKVLNPNNVSLPSQIAAIAALEDHKYMQKTCELTIGIRQWVAGELLRIGFKTYPSFANFILFDCLDAVAAEDLESRLQLEGIFLRRQAGVGLSHAMRMTIGSKEAMAIALQHLSDWKDLQCK